MPTLDIVLIKRCRKMAVHALPSIHVKQRDKAGRPDTAMKYILSREREGKRRVGKEILA